MAINYPGPFEIRIAYTEVSLASPTIQHLQRLNISLVGTPAQGDVFGNYDINDKDGATTTDLATLVEDYLAVFNALFNSTMDIDGVELWKYPVAQSFDSVFWSSYTPTANAGTGTGTPASAGQDIYVFRSAEGGIMKLSLMDSLQTPGVPQAYGALAATPKALVDFVLDGDGVNYAAPFLARDTSYPFAFKQRFPGRNEALWKKRNGRD